MVQRNWTERGVERFTCSQQLTGKDGLPIEKMEKQMGLPVSC